MWIYKPRQDLLDLRPEVGDLTTNLLCTELIQHEHSTNFPHRETIGTKLRLVVIPHGRPWPFSCTCGDTYIPATCLCKVVKVTSSPGGAMTPRPPSSIGQKTFNNPCWESRRQVLWGFEAPARRLSILCHGSGKVYKVG